MHVTLGHYNQKDAKAFTQEVRRFVRWYRRDKHVSRWRRGIRKNSEMTSQVKGVRCVITKKVCALPRAPQASAHRRLDEMEGDRIGDAQGWSDGAQRHSGCRANVADPPVHVAAGCPLCVFPKFHGSRAAHAPSVQL